MAKKKQSRGFIVRWLIASVAMFVCLNVFGQFDEGSWSLEHAWWFYLVAGFVFSLVNTLIKPLVTLLSLPLLLVTLGAFTIVINALMMALTIKILPGVSMDFWGVIGSCVLVAVVNWLANLALDSVK